MRETINSLQSFGIADPAWQHFARGVIALVASGLLELTYRLQQFRLYFVRASAATSPEYWPFKNNKMKKTVLWFVCAAACVMIGSPDQQPAARIQPRNAHGGLCT